MHCSAADQAFFVEDERRRSWMMCSGATQKVLGSAEPRQVAVDSGRECVVFTMHVSAKYE